MKRRSFLAGLGALLTFPFPFPSVANAFVRPDKPSNPLLMPYKGKTTMDAAAFYCPYIPGQKAENNAIQSIVIEKTEIQKRIEFVTRYQKPLDICV
jgi:hypothetical protein